MFSRYFVIVIAFGAAAYRANDRAWIEAAGLGSLGIGLVLFRIADLKHQPLLKRLGWLFFGITISAMAVVFKRDYLR